MLIIFLQKLSIKTTYICYHRSIIKNFIYLVELLLDEDAECIEALSALESRVGEYTAIGLFLAPGIFQLLPEFL